MTYRTIKKWFTLIEMVIVLLVVMLLLGTTLNISTNFSHNLEFKNQKEEFAWLFTKIVTTVMSSNYNTVWIFTGMKVDIGSNNIVQIDNRTTTTYFTGINIINMMIDATPVNHIVLDIVPYQLWCTSIPKWSVSTFQLTKWVFKSCFRIDLVVCKLSELPCL
jgi:prepilin-type N-terminal cleavage/methylation domain-containing protein